MDVSLAFIAALRSDGSTEPGRGHGAPPKGPRDIDARGTRKAFFLEVSGETGATVDRLGPDSRGRFLAWGWAMSPAQEVPMIEMLMAFVFGLLASFGLADAPQAVHETPAYFEQVKSGVEEGEPESDPIENPSSNAHGYPIGDG